MFILHNQYHVWWWPGDARRQGINSHGIDLFCLKYSCFSTSRINSNSNSSILDSRCTFQIWLHCVTISWIQCTWVYNLHSRTCRLSPCRLYYRVHAILSLIEDTFNWGMVIYILVSKMVFYWFRYWRITCSVLSHYLIQWWLIVNWSIRNIFQWNLNKN